MMDGGLPEVKRYVAEKVRVCASECVSTAALRRGEIHPHIDHAMQRLLFHFDTYLHGMTKETISIHKKWPKTWWDAVKQRWFPGWALRRWPVQYERIDVDQKIFLAVCPHIDDEPNRTHLQWMVAEYEKA